MNAITNNGGPAFPATNWSKDGDFLGDNQGMTLRDYFAAKALPTLLREYRDEVEAGGTGFNVSEDAYAIADAMLKARAA